MGDTKIVDVNIRRIRSKIEDEPSEPSYIETVWGIGYRWKEKLGREQKSIKYKIIGSFMAIFLVAIY